MKEPVVKPDQCQFSLYVAEKLSKFSKRTRAIAEKRISDMLFELEMGEESIHDEYSINGDMGRVGSQINGQYSFLTMLQL